MLLSDGALRFRTIQSRGILTFAYVHDDKPKNPHMRKATEHKIAEFLRSRGLVIDEVEMLNLKFGPIN